MARRYSEAQLGALTTMGLVPWVRRYADAATAGVLSHAANPVAPGSGAAPGSSTPPSASAVTPVAAVAARPVAAVAATAVPEAAAGLQQQRALPVRVEPAVVTAAPDSIVALGEWLAQCPLAGFARRGERRFETGPEDARLLVVSESATGRTGRLPLEAAEETMLKAMMRAIDLAPGDYSTAVVVGPGQGGEEEAPSVQQRLGDSCSALLWLSRAAVATSGDADSHRVMLAGLPMFRLPHPARLLTDPIVKAQAWRILKALRGELAVA